MGPRRRLRSLWSETARLPERPGRSPRWRPHPWRSGLLTRSQHLQNGPARRWRPSRPAASHALTCVEINQCVGWHHHAIEQASRRWRGGRSARTRRKILISTQPRSHDFITARAAVLVGRIAPRQCLIKIRRDGHGALSCKRFAELRQVEPRPQESVRDDDDGRAVLHRGAGRLPYTRGVQGEGPRNGIGRRQPENRLHEPARRDAVFVGCGWRVGAV